MLKKLFALTLLVLATNFTHASKNPIHTSDTKTLDTVTHVKEIQKIILGYLENEWVAYKTFSGHTSSADSVAWSPNNAYVAATSSDKIKIWELETGTCLHTLTGHVADILSIAWSPDGKQLASGSRDGSIKIWDASTGLCNKTLKENNYYVYSVAWHPQGMHIASSSGDTCIKKWCTKSEKLLLKIQEPVNPSWMAADIIRAVAWSHDGTCIISGGTWSREPALKLWNATTGLEIQRFLDSRDIVTLALSHDGTRIASDGRLSIMIWDIKTGVLSKRYKTDKMRVNSVVWSPDDKYIASGSLGGIINIWDVTSEVCTKTIQEKHEIYSVAWSKDGSYIAYGSGDNLNIWKKLVVALG